MKIMNIGYNQATQQYTNNKQNPPAFKCTVRIAQEAIQSTPNDFFYVTGRVIKHALNKGLPHTKEEVNLARHVQGQPASLTVDLPNTDRSQIQEFVDFIRDRYVKHVQGLSIDLN